jgi:serine/threonine protein kinase
VFAIRQPQLLVRATLLGVATAGLGLTLAHLGLELWGFLLASAATAPLVRWGMTTCDTPNRTPPLRRRGSETRVGEISTVAHPVRPDAPGEQCGDYLLPIGSEFAGCRVEAVIRSGAWGSVYEAKDLTCEREVALKLHRIEPDTGRHVWSLLATVARPPSRPSLIEIYDFGEAKGCFYSLERLVSGDSLDRRLASGGRMDPSQAVQIVVQVADAVDVLHRHGLIHRELRPDNIVIAGDHAYLSELGGSLLTSESAASGDSAWNASASSAPEIKLGLPADQRADVYALGSLLYATLTGRLEFDAETATSLDAVRMPTHLGVPGALTDCVARALARDPHERFPSAGDFAQALQDAISAWEESTRWY